MLLSFFIGFFFLSYCFTVLRNVELGGPFTSIFVARIDDEDTVYEGRHLLKPA